MSAQDDELIRRYREAGDQDDARPGEHVRGAVRAHAQMIAAATATNVAAGTTPAPDVVPATSQPAANSSRWKISALGTVALVGLTSMLMLQFERGTPEEKEVAYGQPRAGSPAPAPAPAPAPPAALPKPAPIAAAPAATVAIPADPAASPASARDEAGPPTAPRTPPPPAAPVMEAAKSLAKAVPAPSTQEVESAPTSASSQGGAISGFPASPPLDTDHSLLPGRAPPPAAADGRKRQAQLGAPAEKATAAPSPVTAPAAPAAMARAAAPVNRSLSGGNAASGSFSAPAPAAENSTTASLASTLREAARAGRALQVESLISQGAPVDASDSTGRTALMLAVMNGRTTTVQKLLTLGANPALLDRDGLNAAQLARRLGHTRIADLIDAAS